MIQLLISLLVSSAPAQAYNGAAGINSCSGAVFKLHGMRAEQKALVITNGHCVNVKNLFGGPRGYLAPGESIHDLDSPRVAQATYVNIHTPRGSWPAKAEKIHFATMTGTDLAVYGLQETYAELETRTGSVPMTLDEKSFSLGDELIVHAGSMNRTQRCRLEGRVDLIEGPYRTEQALRLTASCDFWVGFSGSPILRPDGRTFAGLANTHHDAEGEECGLNRPCEVRDGVRTSPRVGQSYGVAVHTLYSCYDRAHARLDFKRPGCVHRAPEYVPASLAAPAKPDLDKTVVAIGNRKSQVCTGVFLAKDVVLTAAHCVQAEIGVAGDFVYPMSLAEGYDPIRGARLRIREAVLHPKKSELDVWLPIEEGSSYPFDNPDLALLKLEEEYPAAVPAELATSGMDTAGRSATFAGFGRINQSWQRAEMIGFRLLAREYSSIAADFADLPAGNTRIFMNALERGFDLIAPYFLFVKPESSGRQTLCHGDSGGPLFFMEDGKMKILGVASLFMPHPLRGNPACGDSYLSVFARTEPHQAWLRAELARLTAR